MEECWGSLLLILKLSRPISWVFIENRSQSFSGNFCFNDMVIISLFVELCWPQMSGKVVPAELTHGAQLVPSAVLSPSAQLRALDPSKSPFLDALPGHLLAYFSAKKDSISSPPSNSSIGAYGPKCIVVSASALRCCALTPPLRRLSKRVQQQAEAAGVFKRAPEKPVCFLFFSISLYLPPCCFIQCLCFFFFFFFNACCRHSLAGHVVVQVLKLFAKHQKVEEQARELAREKPLVVVGTPNRLLKLLELSSPSLPASAAAGSKPNGLCISSCELLVLDATFADTKKSTLLTMPGKVASSYLIKPV
jgi:hypothetical protein